MTEKEKLKGIIMDIKGIIEYPIKGKDERRTEDGYPSEIVYDEYAYKRMVRSYRDALKRVLRNYK